MNQETRTSSPPEVRHTPLTFEEIDYFIARGNEIRSRYIRDAAARAWRWLASPFRPARAPDRIEPVANSLAAIRSAVEILRDSPDLNPGDRRRFADIILREEARLEAILNIRGGRAA